MTREFCYRCFKPSSVCVCASLPQVANRTLVYILQHPRERHKPIGTVRFAHLGLQRCEVEVNAPWTGVPSVLATCPPPGAALLFPSDKARAVESLSEAERPTTLVVLDGTWHQVKALVKNNPWLEDLPHVFLATPEPSRYRIRAEPQVHYLSTLEAIVATLGFLEPETAGLPDLLRAFDGMIDVQIERSSVRNTRRPKVRQTPRRLALPPELTQHPQRHVLLHVETVGARHTARPIQVCAWRVATGERFECLIAHEAAADARKCVKIELSAAQFAQAVPAAEFGQRWRQFLREDDLLLAWHQRALDVLEVQDRGVLLKAAWCNLDHSKAGHLTDVLAELGVAVQPAEFSGRAGLHMGELRAILDCLLQRA